VPLPDQGLAHLRDEVRDGCSIVSGTIFAAMKRFSMTNMHILPSVWLRRSIQSFALETGTASLSFLKNTFDMKRDS
jgi:hypothetical protein